MSNLTLVIDDEVLHRARVRAATEGTSVNAQVRDFIRGYADSDDAARQRPYGCWTCRAQRRLVAG